MRRQWVLALLSVLLLQAGLPSDANSQSKAASISLRAKWTSTPTLLEASEFLSEEEPGMLWRFLQLWHEQDATDGRGCWDRIVSTASMLLSPAMTQVLQVSLGIRQYSPRIELFRTEAEAAGIPQDGCAFVDFGNRKAVSLAELQAVLADLAQVPTQGIIVHDFDHMFSASSAEIDTAPPVTAVLYGALGTEAFWSLHQALVEAADAYNGTSGGPRLQYIYRPVLLGGCTAGAGDGSDDSAEQCFDLGTGDNLQLPGFGVEMVIKNMEYSALDDKKVAAEKAASGQEELPDEDLSGFNFKRLVERKPELQQELLGFRDYLLASSSADESLKVWDLKDLGLQATQRIAKASDALRSLGDISQNFPNLAATLSRSTVDKAVRTELLRNQAGLPGGANFMLLNGLFMDPEVELYDLVDRIRTEVRLAEQLKASRLDAEDLLSLLTLRSEVETPDGQDIRIDLLSSNQVVFANDVETDPQYRSWSWSVTELLRPMFPGSLPRVKRNLFTLVMIVDPGTPEGIRHATYGLELVSGGQLPIRLGLLVASSEMLQRVSEAGEEAAAETAWQDLSPGEKAAGLFAALVQEERPLAALQFLAAIPPHAEYDGAALEPPVTREQVEAGYQRYVQDLGSDVSTTVEAQKLVEGGVAKLLARQAAALAPTGVMAEPNSLWLNGAPLPDMPALQAKLGYGIQFELQRLQEMVYFGKLTDEEEDVPGFLMRHFKAVPRYNPRVADTSSSGPAASRQLSLHAAVNAPALTALGYLHHPGTEDTVKAISHWIAADLSTQEGKKLLLEALKHLGSPNSGSSRIGILQHGSGEHGPSLLEKAVLAATQLPARRAKVPAFLVRLLAVEAPLTEEAVLALADDSGLNSKALQKLLGDVSGLELQIAQQSTVCRDLLRLPAGAAAVMTNGRILLAHSPSQNVTEGLMAADFLLVDNFAATAQLSQQVAEVIEQALANGRAKLHAEAVELQDPADDPEFEDATVEHLSDAALIASSVLAAHLANDPYKVQGNPGKVAEAIREMRGDHTAVVVPGNGRWLLDFTVVLDPLSKAAQQLSAVLEFLRATLKPSIKVHLNPRMELSTLPLSSFYRLALPAFPLTADGRLGMPGLPAATFAGLPSSKVLTLHMDVPEAWLVEPVRAAYDLDNLRLSDLGSDATLNAEFELEALLLTGSCTDVSARRRDQVTPRGVQLHLGTAQQPHQVDTLVMSNLGYYQLKAAPGVFNLRLAPGRSQELYTVVQPDTEPDTEVKAAGDEVQIPVVIDSFSGRSQRLKLRKRLGFETADVLDEVDESGGLLQSVSSWFGGSKDGGRQPSTELSPEDDPETIHIFTIASGHMYERLQKIMILSLLRNTKNRVKVWFIKNYMSPQMKRFLPHMAAHYGFDYEFVTYKWPSWLHKQTEKQRIIWAYKILFLDVLFPLNLRKVIFVDSDQIMRADFAELLKMDLQGAPMAYTPFCDNNKEMDGFRFWNQGFWREHLKGKPYHISALYVVDLVKFRQMAAGDQLRVIYEQLSKDPNSLSNLDQDLPNYAQHNVPIYSLPQEWLWCETWCGNETKPAAKTIDLCNNPLTKEPKLQGARRIVTEWPALDAEAQAFTAEVEETLAKQAREAGALFESGELQLSSSTQEEALAAANAPAEQGLEPEQDLELEQETDSRGDSRSEEQSHHDATEL